MLNGILRYESARPLSITMANDLGGLLFNNFKRPNRAADTEGRINTSLSDFDPNTQRAMDKSGWIALRASGPGHPNSPLPALFAHTAPIWIEVGDAPARSTADAHFFLQWIDDLDVIIRARDRAPTAELRRHIHSQLDAARAVFAKIAKEGK